MFRYLCSERALKGEDDSCLHEKGDIGKDLERQKKKKVSNKEEIKDDFPTTKEEL